MTIPIGIDLGTSTSIITGFENDQCKSYQDNSAATPTEVIPSVVAYDTQNDKTLVGEAAENFPDCVREAKRKMGKEGEEARCTTGGKDLKPEEVSALILKHLKAVAEESMFGEKVTDVILTVPAIFSNKARVATLTAGEEAGLNIIQLINEPVAAAIYYSYLAQDKWQDGNKTIMVFDFGGGTLDFSVGTKVLNMLNFVCTGGDPQLGGKDIDEMFMAYVKNRFLQENPNAKPAETLGVEALLKKQVILCKKTLSRADNAKIYVNAFATENGRPVDLDISVSRDEFNDEVLKKSPIPGQESIINRIVKSLDDLFNQNSDKVKKEDVDYLLFVGGSSYIPLIQDTLKEYMGIPEDNVYCQEPNLAVSRGAALFAAQKAGFLDPKGGDISVTPVTPHGIGCDITDKKTGAHLYSQWVAPQQALPFEGSFPYQLLYPDQTAVRFGIYQSTKDEDNQDLEDTEFTGCENQIMDIPPSTDGNCRKIDATVKYDESGILYAKFVIPSTGQSMELKFEPKASASEASKQKIEAMTKNN